ncbi:YfgM family protein [Vibrio cholerae]|uniref:YfgM family protein n=1 Tax=Vibrio cholerae TaxID=666 RepID=UPI001A1D57D3|nr:YfgM family protein [Vibrio cholerae]EGQ9440461.1 tetratricopeptide repeat protein [Vibrio cholerae]EJL6267550.1 YfgM family protein [Vibrio cholerae]EJL6281215.1 YfgM family protein [Vibrio cholerae]EJX9125366.1 YfgM family protein [Vibrio cholerae]
MELYDTEEQQVEAIKDWWKENGKAVIFGAVIGLGGLFGWRYYQDSVVAAQEAASQSYSKAMDALQAKGIESEGTIQTFIDANKETEYAVLAAMQLAKAQVDAGQLDEALAQLEWAKGATKDTALKPLLTFRVARLQAEQGQFDDALTQLTSIQEKSWAGRVAELRGDILMRKGDSAAAYAAYTEAQQAEDASQTLQMKLDDLAK